MADTYKSTYTGAEVDAAIAKTADEQVGNDALAVLIAKETARAKAAEQAITGIKGDKGDTGAAGADAVVYTISPSSLIYKPATSAVSVNVLKTSGNQTAQLTELPSGWVLVADKTLTDDTQAVLPTVHSTLPASVSVTGASEVTVSLYDKDPTMIDTSPASDTEAAEATGSEAKRYAVTTLLQVSDGDKGDTGAAGAAAVQYRIVPIANPFPASGDVFSNIFAIYKCENGVMEQLDETSSELADFSFVIKNSGSEDGRYDIQDYRSMSMTGTGAPVRVELYDSDNALADVAWLINE